ncbi:hypothetical protein EYF80_001235 [Liparis tanakae]|uniref:Uncharacterized protein n=1 Tax=Liparis tanakae TaxID=230148 RepID=A0A4Z2JF89_9TELE|nr:hypothetical protein EYF80_001235 [Liparis tanakae]
MSWCATLVPSLEEWSPVKRVLTIDRQGRANCISIGGGYWATEKQQRPNEAVNTIEPTSLEQEANSPSDAASPTTTWSLTGTCSGS